MLLSNAWYIYEPMILLLSATRAKQRSIIILSSIIILCVTIQCLVGLQAYASHHFDSILHGLSYIETRFDLDIQDDLIQPIMCQN